MTYADARAWLDSLGEFHMAFGLDRVQEVLRRLGSPERCAPAIHVAGTNGKGATSAYASAILRAAGKRVGLYTSPHLSCPNERIAVDGSPVDDDAFATAVSAVHDAAEDGAQGVVELTFFEVMTCAAFVAFRAASVEAMVLEVGLGGRLDATNVVEPAVAVVTSIARDHVEILGDSIEERAGEKAGIVKAGRPAICTARDPAAAAVIGARAREVSAPFWRIGRELLVKDGSDRTGGSFSIETSQPAPSLFVSGCRLTALGAHFRDDAAGAALAAKVLYPELAAPQIVAGLAGAHWPGRGEVIPTREGVDVILDGAHNPGAAAALVRALAAQPANAAAASARAENEAPPVEEAAPQPPVRPTVILFASMKDKEHAPIFESLAALAPLAVRTLSASTTRSADPAALAEIARTVLAPRGCDDVAPGGEATLEAELAAAIRRAGPGGRVLVTGSLYLVGRVREALLGPPAEIG